MNLLPEKDNRFPWDSADDFLKNCEFLTFHDEKPLMLFRSKAEKKKNQKDWDYFYLMEVTEDFKLKMNRTWSPKELQMEDEAAH